MYDRNEISIPICVMKVEWGYSVIILKLKNMLREDSLGLKSTFNSYY